MLALSRRIPRSVRNQDQRKWEGWPSRLITGKTIGIFGIGSIAKTVAPRCKAFDMTVIGISSGLRDMPGFDRMVHRDTLIETVRELDYLLLLTPYSPETHNIIDAKVFAAMKSTAPRATPSRPTDHLPGLIPYGRVRTIPPSTATIEPFTSEAAGDSRKAPTRPTSSGRP